jgi:hypothetical protein
MALSNALCRNLPDVVAHPKRELGSTCGTHRTVEADLEVVRRLAGVLGSHALSLCHRRRRANPRRA